MADNDNIATICCPSCGRQMKDSPINRLAAVDLTRHERLMCEYLASRPGKWVKRNEVIAAIYPEGGPERPELCLRAFVHHSRKKLTPIGLVIEVAKGQGANGMRMIVAQAAKEVA
jgi:DNA-binding response OmpR family regulator